MLAWLLSLTMVASFAQAEVGSVEGAPPAPAAARSVSPLTGLPCDPALAQRNPLLVMVENTRAARPQSGMDQAEVVIEVHVEGGVTRYTNFFVCTDAGVIGPVRSTRQVYASWAKTIGAWLSHAWAKPSGYEAIKDLGIHNIDGVRLRGAKTPFYRVDSRQGPHNLYTSTAELRRYAEDKGYAPSPMGTPLFVFKDPQPVAPVPFPWVGFDFNGLTYFSDFEYDPATNRYKRFLAGEPHIVGSEAEAEKRLASDRLNGAPHTKDSAHQLTVDNVLVLVMKERVAGDKGVLHITTTGEGEAFLYRDGTRVEGRWVRAKEADRYEFLAADGTPLEFNRGRTWIALIAGVDKLVHQVPKTLAKRVEGPTGP